MAVFITGGGVKPKMFTPVNYIESSGSQRIILPSPLTQEDSTEVVFQLTQDTSGYAGVFGNRDVKNSANGYALYAYQRAFTFINGMAYTTVHSDTTDFLNKHTIKVSKNVVNFDGQETAVDLSAILDQQADSTGIFCFLTESTVEFPSSMRLYYMKVSRNGNARIELYPAIDDNNVYCVYDIVSKQHIYNSGSGLFTGG